MGHAMAVEQPVYETEAFKNWFGDSKTLDDDGVPMEFYHGSTNDFDTFDISYSSKGNYVGEGFYFSTSQKDIGANYTGGGSDHESRIEKLASKIQSNGYNNEFGELPKEKIELAEEDWDYAVELARELTSDGLEIEYSCFLKMEKPFVLDDKRLYSFEMDFEHYLEQAKATVLEEDYEDEDAYTEALEEEARGLFYDSDEEDIVYAMPETENLIKALRECSEDFSEHDIEAAIQDLRAEFEDLAFSNNDVFRWIKNNDNLLYISDDEGDYANSVFFSDVVKKMGHDGIIMNAYEANKRWKMDGIDKDTYHYIVFDPNQIKSSSENTQFSLEDNNIFSSKINPNNDNETKLTNEGVIAVLHQKIGKTATNALIDDGSLVVKSSKQLSFREKLFSCNSDGLYNAQNNTVILISDKLTPDTVMPTFIHEMGGHHGFQHLMSPTDYKAMLGSFDFLVKNGDKTAIKAKELADKNTPNAKIAQEEYIPYLLTLAAQNNEQKPKIIRFVDNVTTNVKGFLRDQLGINLRVTPDDMLGIAKKMINKQIDLSIKNVYLDGNKYESKRFNLSKDILDIQKLNPLAKIQVFFDKDIFGQKMDSYLTRKNADNDKIISLLPPYSESQWKEIDEKLAKIDPSVANQAFSKIIRDAAAKAHERKETIMEKTHAPNEKIANRQENEPVKNFVTGYSETRDEEPAQEPTKNSRLRMR